MIAGFGWVGLAIRATESSGLVKMNRRTEYLGLLLVMIYQKINQFYGISVVIRIVSTPTILRWEPIKTILPICFVTAPDPVN